MIIDKSFIEKTIKYLTENKLYRNEAQLQFDLAWEIQKEFERNQISDWHVELEYLSATSNKTNKKGKTTTQSYYTDIMLISDRGEFIPIELKYKTKSIYNNGKQLLKTHGAQDLGRFDFLWDVQRVENLKNKKWRVNEKLHTFSYGFAIMLTNDNLYWKTTRAKFITKKPAYYDFCIGQGEKIKKTMKLNWQKGISAKTIGDWRNKVCPIVFDRDYSCDWEKLDCCSSEFKILIFEI